MYFAYWGNTEDWAEITTLKKTLSIEVGIEEWEGGGGVERVKVRVRVSVLTTLTPSNTWVSGVVWYDGRCGSGRGRAHDLILGCSFAT